MPLKRNVMMQDGQLLGWHVIAQIVHTKAGNTWLEVESFTDENQDTAIPGAAYYTSLEYNQDTALTFDAAYQLLADNPQFAEYVDEAQAALDEVLPILTDEQAATVPDAFREWKPETEYNAGDRRKYNGALYKCLQDHTSQADWSPDVAVSLWARILIPDPEVIPVWEQPDSTNPYMIGDKVHFPTIDDPVYESTIDGNVWSPEAYPQGWRLVTGDEE